MHLTVGRRNSVPMVGVHWFHSEIQLQCLEAATSNLATGDAKVSDCLNPV